ncbi:MAG: hypothetical protein AAFO95_14810 [Cyanobacteria bacterium J06600_6]
MFHQWLFRGVFVCSLLSLLAEPLGAQNRIIQQSSSRATATGRNSFAASQVRQSASQNSSANPQQGLTIEQYGSANATADGNNNVVISNIDQESDQQRSRYITGDRQNVQRATINGRAWGRNNRVFSNTRQYNRQN